MSYYKNHNQSSFLFLSIRMGFTRSTNNKISTTSTVYQQLWHSDNNGSSAKKIKTQSRWLTHTHYIKLVQQTRKELTTQPWRSARESLCLFNKQKGAFYFIFFFLLCLGVPVSFLMNDPFFLWRISNEPPKFFFFFLFAHNNWLSVTRSRLLLSRIPGLLVDLFFFFWAYFSLRVAILFLTLTWPFSFFNFKLKKKKKGRWKNVACNSKWIYTKLRPRKNV